MTSVGGGSSDGGGTTKGTAMVTSAVPGWDIPTAPKLMVYTLSGERFIGNVAADAGGIWEARAIALVVHAVHEVKNDDSDESVRFGLVGSNDQMVMGYISLWTQDRGLPTQLAAIATGPKTGMSKSSSLEG